MTAARMTRSWQCHPGALTGLLDKARGAGASVTGSGSEGALKASTPLGPLEADYTFDGERFTVSLTTKPAMLPIEMIWSRLDSILGPPVSEA